MSSLGIFDKETKTYKKVADLSKPAVIDSAMSDSSTNAVQNKVVKKYVDDRTVVDSGMSDTSTNAVQNKAVKSYVDGRTALDSAMSDTSTNAVQNKVVKSYVDTRTTVDSGMSDTSTNPVQNKAVKSYVDGKFKQNWLTQMLGDGKTGYCQLCTIKINGPWINIPIEITVQERFRGTLDRLTVLFDSVDNNDPGLTSFNVFGGFDGWYISKRAASTWVIYGTKSESWSDIRVVDYIGFDGINVTWDVTGVTALPDSKTKAEWGGNVNYAVSAGSANSASTVNGHTVNSDVPSGAKFTDTDTWRPLGTTADTACAGNDSRLSNARPASDVYAWAKASSKPSYSWSEITNKPSTFTPASHTHDYLPLSGGTITGGPLNIRFPDDGNHGNWNEGIRIHEYNNWITIALCGSDNTGDAGTSANTWSIHNNEGNFYIARNGSNSSSSAILSCINNSWSINDNAIIHSGNIGSQSVNYASSADRANSASTVNGHTVNSDVPSGAKFTDTTYNDATTSAHGLMTPAMVSKLNGIAEGANRTTVDASMTDTSTNPVQNKVVKKYVDGTQTGYHVGTNPPENTRILWIDSSRGGMVKYFTHETSKWHPVRAKGYDTPVDLINEGYWSYSFGPGITVDNISAIYDINKDEVTITIKNLSITSDAFVGPNDMVDIVMPIYNLGRTGSIKPDTVRPVSGEPIPMNMVLDYPHGRIQTGPPYGIYKPVTMQTIIFKVSHIH